MQCTSNYLQKLKTQILNKRYNKLDFSYSDHTQSDVSAIVALAFGARVLKNILL